MSSRLGTTVLLTASCLIAATTSTASEALAVDRGASGTWQKLLKLKTTASLLQTTAHPDDEHGGVLTRLSRGEGARVALVSLTRGESGDNAIHVIVTAVDNSATRKMVYDAVKELHEREGVTPNVIVLDPGNGEGKGNLLTWASIEGQAPFEWPPDLYTNLANPTDRAPGGSCSQEQEEGNTQTIAENMMAAAVTHLVAEAMRYSVSAVEPPFS